MDETVLLVLIIAGFLALTIFSLAAMLVMYRREKNRQEARNLEKVISEFDEILNSALQEINKLGSVVQSDISGKIKEIEEKYNSVLFLYNLIDEKQKEVSDLTVNSVGAYVGVLPSEIAPVSVPVQEDVPEQITEVSEPVVSVVRSPVFRNQKQKEIWDMREEGQSISDIAKSLGLGQGEVKLILDLVEMA